MGGNTIAKRFKSLKGKARANAIYNYRMWTENPKATVKEIEEYYEMANGYGGFVYLDDNGDIMEVEDYPELY